MTDPTPNALRLRPATLADLPLLRRWDEQPHVIESDPHDDWQWEQELPRKLDWREQLIAELDGRPIGFMEIIDPARDDSQYWGADVEPGLRALDIWIGEAADLGQGHGTTMMGLALQRCFAAPEVQAVMIDPIVDNRRAHVFYQRLGFEPIGPRRFGDDLCLVHRLTRERYRQRLAGSAQALPQALR
jgi:aminoglycoside 6'-N-acetyltransferase